LKTELITAPAAYPVTLADTKDAIVVSGTTDDDLIRAYIHSATEAAEQFLRRRLVYQTIKLHLDDWPDGDAIVLPFGWLQSVTHVKYKDTDGDQSTFSSDDYIAETATGLLAGRIVLGYGETWPSTTLYPSSPIEIQFVCGRYAGAEWEASTAKSAGDVVAPTYSNRSGLVFVAGGDGTTDATEPTWTTTAGGTTTDNDITWTAHPAIPDPICQAIYLMVGELYMQREPLVIGTIVQQLPVVKNLLTPFKLWRP